MTVSGDGGQVAVVDIDTEEPEHMQQRRRSLASARSRAVATSLGPAAAIILVQQVFFGISLGLFVRGVIVGALTGLIALGMSLIYRSNRIINFAQADLGFLPTVLAFLLIEEAGLPYLVAVAAGLGTALALGAGTERLVIRRFFRAPRLLVTIATIGLSQVLAGAALLLPTLWDRRTITDRFPEPFEWTQTIGGVNFSANDFLGLLLAPVLIVLVATFLQFSDVGTAIRASADSADRASLLGVPVYRLQTLVWSGAAVLAFVTVMVRSGILGMPQAGSALGLSVLLRALVALMLGRLTDMAGVTSAAVALGVLETGIYRHHSTNGEFYVQAIMGLIVVAAIIVRRREVGSREQTEDSAWRAAEDVRPVPRELARLPAVRRTRAALLVVIGVIAVALPQILDTGQVFKAATLLMYALLGLSLVLLSGWGGTISLGHAAFFGLGAAVAGSAIINLEVDLIPAMLMAAVVGAIVAALVGVPALRLRGLYLAVTTFAFGLAGTAYLLNDEFFDWVPGGTAADGGDERVGRVPLLGGFEVESERGIYYLALVTLVLVMLAVRNIRASRFGRALVALRDNDRAAQAYAISPERLQLGAFALSGAIAAIAGSLFVHQQGFDQSQFGGMESLAVFILVVVGGMTSPTGAVLGALFLLGARWFLPNEWQVLATGSGVIVALLLFPGGLASVVFRVRDYFLRELARSHKLEVPGYTRPAEPTPEASAPEDAAPRTASGPSMEGNDDALLDASGVQAGYGGVPVLFGVDVEVREGEAVALLGTNGAGKSTLLRAISGLLEPTAGRVSVSGEDITRWAPHKIAARGVIQMPGGKGIFPSLTVTENLRVAGWLHRRDATAVSEGIQRARALFPVLAERANERAANLSGGQQQMLALAMAVLGRPRLLMIDELSLGLAPSVVSELMQFVNQLRQEGTTLLVVEQSVNVALEIADRAVFLERGEVQFSGRASELLERPDLLRSVFLSSATGRSRPGYGQPAARSRRENESDTPAPLESIELTAGFGGVRAVDGVSFEIRSGEIFGVIGPNGAGKTTLFDVLSGFVPSEGGRVILGGHDITHLAAAARARRGLGRSFQEARLFSGLTVEETIGAALERWVSVGDPLSAAFYLPNAYDSEQAIRRRVQELIDLLGLGPYRSLFIRELSTGTRRVVDLACLLAHRPSVVLLDEPAAGIAQREVEELAPLIRRIRDEMGASVILVEHDIPLVESVADRMMAMDRGRAIAVDTPAEVLNHPAVVSSYLGDNKAAVNRSDSPSE